MQVKKAIILAGGYGTRLSPMTLITNKHLLPIYNKPMIYYPLSTCMLGGIKNYLLISNDKQIYFFKKLFGDGSRLGIKISYKVQKSPLGLPQAISLGNKFINNEPVCINLGDHILFGSGLSDILTRSFSNFYNSKIFIQKTKKPSSYGVINFSKNGSPIKIVEKPKKPKSNFIVTGLYLYTGDVINKIKKLKKSDRNEYEITDLNNIYLKEKKLDYEDLGRGIAWFDAGEPERILEISNFISLIENKQGQMIGCIEEIALRNKFITKRQFLDNIKFYRNSLYADYLKTLI